MSEGRIYGYPPEALHAAWGPGQGFTRCGILLRAGLVSQVAEKEPPRGYFPSQ